MVYGLIIQNALTGTVYHYEFFTTEGNDENRKARIHEIVAVVRSEYRFRVECSASPNRYKHAATTMSGRPGMGQHRDELVTTATPAELLQGEEIRRNSNSSNNSTTEGGSNNMYHLNGFMSKNGNGSAISSNGQQSNGRSSSSSMPSAHNDVGSAFSCEPPERSSIVGGLFSSLKNAWVPSPSSANTSNSSVSQHSTSNHSSHSSTQFDRTNTTHASEGTIRLPRNELLEFPKLILWRQVLNSIFVLICNSDDNLVLASNFLSIFVSLLCEKFNDSFVTSKPEQFLEKSEIVMDLTSKLLPCGQLMFMTPSMAQYIASPHFQENSYDMAESSDFVDGGE